MRGLWRKQRSQILRKRPLYPALNPILLPSDDGHSMRRTLQHLSSARSAGISRGIHASAPISALKQKTLPIGTPKLKPRLKDDMQDEEDKQEGPSTRRAERPTAPYIKRNELGVQMLARPLHAQLFKHASFPAPDPAFTHIAREHLGQHGLDPALGSVLPDTSFALPSLQGRDLDEHFARIGSQAAEPWLSLSSGLASFELPPRPTSEDWAIQSGWTKYTYLEGGGSFHEAVEFPEGGALVFDVETMPNYHPYAIMATAATPDAWYAWISPWLLDESSSPEHLIPLGPPGDERVVIGHNVSYDRARAKEEYSLKGTKTRWLDTMALHIAVKGISSHQRPAWMKHRKSKEKARERQLEAVEAIQSAIVQLREAEQILERSGQGNGRLTEVRQMRREMEEGLPQLLADAELFPSGSNAPSSSTKHKSPATEDADDSDADPKRWEDLTSANSLADVARLHCGIEISKEVRSDFMTATPAHIHANILSYLDYCASDVHTTHAVFNKVLPQFLERCPSPVSFAGVLSMGSSFLTVDESWERYLENSETTFRELEAKVKTRLLELAENARGLADGESWKEDEWLGQLDWEPKVVGKTRGMQEASHLAVEPILPPPTLVEMVPAWYATLTADPLSKTNLNRIVPLLLRLTFGGQPLTYDSTHGWHTRTSEGVVRHLPTNKTGVKLLNVLGKTHGQKLLDGGNLQGVDEKLLQALISGKRRGIERKRVLELADGAVEAGVNESDPWLNALDWEAVPSSLEKSTKVSKEETRSAKEAAKKAKEKRKVYWPKWYWDLAKPKKGLPPGTLDITPRSRITPLLLRLSWLGWPLFHSREHGWTFRVAPSTPAAPHSFVTRLSPLQFYDAADEVLHEQSLREGYTFYKLPHKDGEAANVGNPLAKPFMKFAADGTLTSPGNEAREALDMNAQCSYWISARDRIMNQHVVWQDDKLNIGFPDLEKGKGKKWGVIIPQVITMGTVTRRAIEKTWLTASNAKANRVGSELKALVRAPPGYAIVGADVDSEELWISSAMGDAQFGLHGATAIGWMTLEGTKAAGTDLHSKTAGILGISRDQAKVFNYSRIYGAGMRHAVLLLLQANAGMLPEEAQRLAENLYASTKGKSTHRTDLFGRKFWFGGTESFVFNKLEEIALSDRPQTPALGCGVTDALSKEFLPAGFGTDYMTSRINWVVQSSGVDYLHLLIVSMDHLIAKYNINARYLISVHDELRYLVTEQDKYRLALALQVANLWTRSLFAYKLGMDDLPQGVAFFSAVDVDTVLRKEVDMPCVTPSQPHPIPSGESLNIAQVLERTGGGSLHADGRPMMETPWSGERLPGYQSPDCLRHRSQGAAFLRAQATSDFAEVKHLAQREAGTKYKGGIGGPRKHGKKKTAQMVPDSLVAIEGVDWELVNEALRSTKSTTA
ncbi:hypothetical protein HWV62_5969 [Athelia sp. TMB]|nr:hypothetical protein HWV62_5969 [Athelia sp. TMB]